MEPEVAFGQVLREMRKGRGLSQEALALESGVERNYISLLELGKNSASLRMIFKLAAALEVSVSEFVGLVETRAAEKTRPGRARSSTPG